MVQKDSKFYGIELKTNTDTSDVWAYLLQVKLPQADTIEFTVDSLNQLPESINLFCDEISLCFVSDFRWQNKQLHPISVIHLPCNQSMKEYLVNVTHLGKWGMDIIDNPDDPALYLSGECVMWTISHENMVFIQISREDLANLRQNFGRKITVFPHDDNSPPTRISRIVQGRLVTGC